MTSICGVPSGWTGEKPVHPFSTRSFRSWVGHTSMKLSRYTLFVPEYPASGEYLVYNTLSQSVAVINRELKEAMDNLEDGRQPEGEALEHLQTLQEMEILVPDEVDENRVVEYWFQSMKFDTSRFECTVLTTYDCNFACTYCVEEGVKAKVSMDEETCRRTVGWLIERVQEARSTSIRVDFYGGEPLLNVPAIEAVGGAMREFAESEGMEYQSGVVTNGALLTREIVDRLVKVGVSFAKITLDGDRDVHDRRRPFRSGRGSFDVILANLGAAVDRLGVTVGGNFDSENLASIPKLLDRLKDEGLERKLALVEFKPVVSRIGEPGAMEVGCTSFSEGRVPEEMVSLRGEIVKRGFPAREAMAVNLCGMTRACSGFVVDPKGRVYKCPAFVGREEFAVGDVREDELSYRHTEFVTLDVWRECLDCPYVPLCAGGCRYAAYLRGGDLERPACEREYFERAGTEMLKMDYELGLLDDR